MEIKKVGGFYATSQKGPPSLAELIDFCKECSMDLGRISVVGIGVSDGYVEVREYENPIKEYRKEIDIFHEELEKYRVWAKSHPRQAKIQDLQEEIEMIKEEIRREEKK